ncbi:putative protein transport protein Sec24A [Trypanosoma vivax]|nr:putative protein transport protein Sec24A [Trypanosoma vivax]
MAADYYTQYAYSQLGQKPAAPSGTNNPYEGHHPYPQCDPQVPTPAVNSNQGHNEQYGATRGSVQGYTPDHTSGYGERGGAAGMDPDSCRKYKPYTPPRSPVPQTFMQVTPRESQLDSAMCWDIQLAKSHDKSEFLDHPSIPRFLYSYLEQDMAQTPPSVPHVRPVSRATARPTFQTIPSTSQLADTLKLPLGISLQPFAEPHPVEVDFATVGCRIIRCRKCSGYINPYSIFCENGRRWQCILCTSLNEVPTEYYCPLDPQTSLRQDLLQRPELTNCSIDIHPSPEFLRRPPQRPAFLLMLDCSYQAVASGNLQAICNGALAALDVIKDEDAVYMGIIGFASTVYFFNLSRSLQAPRIIVAPDVVHDTCNVDDNFKLESIELPCPANELLVNVKDVYPHLKQLFENLVEEFSATKDVGCAFGPALAAAISLLENNGGKIIASIDGMPSVGEGKLTARFNISKMSGQTKEYTMLSAANEWYKQRALACSNSNISIDLFASSAQEIDLATIAPLARFTSGSIYRCTPVSVNGITQQVYRVLTRYTAFEAVLRVRASAGLVIPNFYGHCHVREPEVLALPVANEDSSYTVELQLTPALKSAFAYIQMAVVHTTRARERRIRVHTYQLGVSSSMGAVVNSANALGIASFLSKMAVDKALCTPFQQVQQRITETLSSALRAVRKHNEGLGLRGGVFVVPDSMRFVPQLLHGFFRSAAVGLPSSQPISPDDRVASMSLVMTAAAQATLPFYAGWSFEVYSPYTQPEELPLPIFSRQSFFRSDGIFLVHIGWALVLWYGRRTEPRILDAFELPHPKEAKEQQRQGQLREQRYDISDQQLIELRERFYTLVWHLRGVSRGAFCAVLEVCPQGNGVIEPLLTRMMMEDEVRTLPSYAAYLREIWQKSSLSK